jgi:eukaryotic-like serine/threonine-protein kinase
MNGRMVSHYRVLDPLGGGGMGIVYDAEDTRLGRRVALKFVPADLARDAQALARLAREARSASALNHPHICTLYDIGEDQGQPFLVLERLEGKTLKSSLAGKAMPADRVLLLGAQMADALTAAHAKGIVHRDVKPANVFVTLRGDVKLLDFGLAKVTETAADASNDVDPDDATKSGEPEPLTGSRAAIGTVAYMSPEQARGERIDFRTDLFSLGAVLYEMATGKPAFGGGTPAVIYEAILARDPAPPRTLNPDIPQSLETILAKALEKDRELRYQTAADLKVDLERARRGLEAQVAPGARPAGVLKNRRGWAPPAAIAGAILLAALAGAWISRRLSPASSPPRFTQLTFRRGVVTSARFSPDGNSVVYSALWDGKPPEIFTRRLESPGSVSLGLPPATLLSVSSKGELAVLVAPPQESGILWIGTLARVPLSGGPLRPVLESVLDADWSPDGRDLAAIRWLDGQFQLEYPLDKVLLRPCPPTRLRVSPRGDRVAVLDDQGGILVVDRKGGRTTLAAPPAHQRLAWSPDGESLLVDAGDLDLRRTLRRVSLNGLVSEVCALAGTLVVHDVFKDGRALLHHGFERWNVRARAPGEAAEHDVAAFANAQVQGLSADGSRVLLWDGGEGPPGSALLLPTRGGPAVRLGEGHPVGLSADALWVLMQTARDGQPPFVLAPTGPGTPRPVPVGRLQGFSAWHVDGRRVGFHAAQPGHSRRTFLAEMAAGDARPVTPEGAVAISEIQPDGRFLAEGSDGALAFHPVEGGAARPVDWKLPSDPFLEIPGLSGDGRFLRVREGSVPARLDLIEIESGRRTQWKTLRPEDTTGVGHIWTVLVTPDGQGYTYTYGLFLEDLFLVEGLPSR